jgi:hypothetical protein
MPFQSSITWTPGAPGRTQAACSRPVRVFGVDRDPVREHRAGGVVLGAVEQVAAVGLGDEPDAEVVRVAAAPLGQRVAEALAAEHLGVEKAPLLRRAGLREHVDEEEVILWDLPEAGVAGGQLGEHLAERAGGNARPTVLFRHRDRQQPRFRQLLDEVAGQDPLRVAGRVVDGELAAELGGDRDRLGVVLDDVNHGVPRP